MTSNYKEEVIGAKKERERLETTEGIDRAAIESVLDKIENAAHAFDNMSGACFLIRA